MQNYDELKLQRLIDGQLDRESIQGMLKRAEDNPELWREMAVGFVEDKIWDGEFQELDNKSVPAISDRQHDAPDSHSRRRPIGRWLAIAAGILLGLSIGYLPSLDWNKNKTVNNPRPAQIAPHADDKIADQSPELPMVQTSFRPDYHLSLKSPDGTPMFADEVPLYTQANAKKMGYDMTQPVEIDNDMADWLKQTGYQLDQNINFITGQLDDGRKFIVPIRTTRIHYGQ